MKKNAIKAAVLCSGIFTLYFCYVGFVGPGLYSRGGQGQECYPNDTCDKGLTCFAIRETHQCEMKVLPVKPEGSPVCYVLTGDDGKEEQACFPKHSECITAFARNMGSKPVVRGCY